MIFSVFTNSYNDETLIIIKEMLALLSQYSCKIYFSEESRQFLFGIHSDFAPEYKLMDLCDIAVAIGGDGTTMKTAKKAAVHGKATLGINGGRLGFLSGIEKNELELLKAVIKGDYKVDERIMLKADIIENGIISKTYHCLNDAVFSRGDFARLIDVKITSNKRELWSVRADGVIISTPTGSTAYSMAAGGPVLSPELNCLVITSICPHSLMDRSIVVNSMDKLEVNTSSDVSNNAILTCDGEEPSVITNETKVVVSLSEYRAKLIKVKPDNFYEVLKKKIIERRV